MDNGIVVRQATESDIWPMAQLWSDMVAEGNPGATPNVPLWYTMTESLIKAQSLVCFVAEADPGKVVGFVDMVVYREPGDNSVAAQIRHIYIAPSHRGKGVSKTLLEHVVGYARSTGIGFVECLVYPDMVTFWGRHGFESTRILLQRRVEALPVSDVSTESTIEEV